MTSRLSITRLGAQGDGVADTPAGPVFVPYALPGETVTASVDKDRGHLLAVEQASPLRVEPPCRHFGTCGGCAIQHLRPGSYGAWKREKLVQALSSQRIEAEIAELVACAPGRRRRASFSARRTADGIVLGFNRMLSNEIVPIVECPILVPALEGSLDRLSRVASALCATGASFRVSVTATASGLDVDMSGAGRPAEQQRRAAADMAMREGIARLSLDGEILVEPRKPAVDFAGVTMEPPPGAFLQATADAEAAMADLVVAHLSRAKVVADLFAGCGTFALRLARRSDVHAVENDAAALVALDRAFRFARGLKRVTAERRDLFRRPLTARELSRFDAVVFDPPRAGAEAQSAQLARSDVPLVAAVSCNPGTLARDLRVLLDGGYTLRSVTPIDQFLWSPHVEAVALLEKPKRRR